MKIYILAHKDDSIFYGVTDNLNDAIKLKKSFPNPEPIRIFVAHVDNDKRDLITQPLVY